MPITVYSKPACPACRGTARYLKKAGLEYNMIDVTQDPEAAEYVASLGYREVPVVVTENESWSGLRIDRILAQSA